MRTILCIFALAVAAPAATIYLQITQTSHHNGDAFAGINADDPNAGLCNVSGTIESCRGLIIQDLRGLGHTVNARVDSASGTKLGPYTAGCEGPSPGGSATNGYRACHMVWDVDSHWSDYSGIKIFIEDGPTNDLPDYADDGTIVFTFYHDSFVKRRAAAPVGAKLIGATIFARQWDPAYTPAIWTEHRGVNAKILADCGTGNSVYNNGFGANIYKCQSSSVFDYIVDSASDSRIGVLHGTGDTWDASESSRFDNSGSPSYYVHLLNPTYTGIYNPLWEQAIQIAAAVPSNTFSITEKGATTTTNYPVQMGRVLTDGEILHYPQVGLCSDSTCGTVSSWLTTQADVKTRYASGYAKFGVLSFLIPTLSSGTTAYFTVRDQSVCNCGSGVRETRANMLANYDFDAEIDVSANSIPQAWKARDVLTAWDGADHAYNVGPVYFWNQGSIATTIVIADHTGALDKGYKDKKYTAVTGSAMDFTALAIPVADATDIAALTMPTVVTLYPFFAGEQICVTSVSGNTLNVGTGCAGTASSNGRGWNGTSAGNIPNTTVVGANAQASVIKAATDATTKAIRPIWEVTFWPSLGKAFVRFIGENASTEAFVNQAYDVTLKLGNASPATVYAFSGFLHSAGTRWTVSRNNQSGQTWSVSTPSGSTTIRKQTWVGGAPPPPVAINHNLAYLEYTKQFPNYDTTKAVSETTININWASGTGFLASAAHQEINGLGGGGCWKLQDADGTGPRASLGDPGESPMLGPNPQWTVEYLYTGDVRDQEMSDFCSLQGGLFPYHYREAKAGKKITRASGNGCTVNCDASGIGHPMSITSRPTVLDWLDYIPYNGTTAADAIKVTGPYNSLSTFATDPSYSSSGTRIGFSTSHFPNHAIGQYFLTGSFYLLEESWFGASWGAGSQSQAPSSPEGRGPTGSEGGSSSDETRTPAWELRILAESANATPDGFVEQSWLNTYINDFVAIEEGARCGAGDVFSWCAASPFHGNANWAWGYGTRVGVNAQQIVGCNDSSCPYTTIGPSTAYPTLHQWQHGIAAFIQYDVNGNSDTNGIRFTPGVGTMTRSSSTPGNTMTLSDAGACSNLVVGQTVYLGCDDTTSTTHCGCDTSIAPGACAGQVYSPVFIAEKSCPTVKLQASIYHDITTHPAFIVSSELAAESQFSSMYLMYALGRATELGFPTQNLADWHAYYWNGVTTSSCPAVSFSGRTPTVKLDQTYYSSFSDLMNGWNSEWCSVTSGYGPGSGVTANGPPTGFSAKTQAAVAMSSQFSTGGSSAWSFVANRVAGDTAYNTNPKWALLPRIGSPVVPPTCSLTLAPSSPGPYTVGQTISAITATAANCGGGTLTWTSSSLPGGLAGCNSVTGTTCTITGTVTTAASYTPTISVSDGGSNTASVNPTIAVNAAPSITSSGALTSGTQGSAYSQALSTSGGTSPLTCAVVTGSLPAGLSFSACTISGTPSAAGTSTFTAHATDSNGITGTTSASLSITIAGSGGGSSPASISTGTAVNGGAVIRH